MLLAAALLLYCHTARPVPQTSSRIPLDERLEKIKMTDLKGRPFTLHQLVGKPVFLNFWATWCGPCVSEMQSIESIYQQYKNDIAFLAVSNEDPAKIRSFIEKHRLSFDFAHLDIDYTDAYVITMPTTLLIDNRGKLVHEEEGFRDWAQYNNLGKLKALVQGK